MSHNSNPPGYNLSEGAPAGGVSTDPSSTNTSNNYSDDIGAHAGATTSATTAVAAPRSMAASALSAIARVLASLLRRSPLVAARVAGTTAAAVAVLALAVQLVLRSRRLTAHVIYLNWLHFPWLDFARPERASCFGFFPGLPATRFVPALSPYTANAVPCWVTAPAPRTLRVLAAGAASDSNINSNSYSVSNNKSDDEGETCNKFASDTASASTPPSQSQS